MKVGDTAWVEVDSFFDIREVTIIKEIDNFYVFNIEDRQNPVQRKKYMFSKTKEDLLEKKIGILNHHLKELNTTGEEVYLMYKNIHENKPEILL